jgi:hypothetical protein
MPWYNNLGSATCLHRVVVYIELSIDLHVHSKDLHYLVANFGILLKAKKMANSPSNC